MNVAPTFPFTRPAPVEVFASDHRSAQIVWRGLGTGSLIARVDDRVVPLGDAAGPGAAVVTDLIPDQDHQISVSVGDRPVRTLRLRTAPCLGGSSLRRIATIGDLHLGEPGFGLVKRMNEPRSTPEPYPLRCASAAVAEAEAWGADMIVIKGDITNESRPEEWETFDRLLERVTVPVVAIPGNHDVNGDRRSLDGADQLRERGLFPSAVQIIDGPAARILVVDSTVPGHGYGRLADRADELEAAVAVDQPIILFTHHHVQTTLLPRFWPLGTTRADGYGVLDRLIDVNPRIFVSSGHTHRNRIRSHRSAVLTEVGSVKDHPGVWAGYEITDHGVRQTMRRISRPDCISWTERTHAVVGGVWGRWSPGQVEDRCVTHSWVPSQPDTSGKPAPQPLLELPNR